MTPTPEDACAWARITAGRYQRHPQHADLEAVAMHAALEALEKYRGQPYRKHRNAIIGAARNRINSFLRTPENLYRSETRDGVPIPGSTSFEALIEEGNWNPPAPDFAPQVLDRMEAEALLRRITCNRKERIVLRRAVMENEGYNALAAEWGMSPLAVRQIKERVVARARKEMLNA